MTREEKYQRMRDARKMFQMINKKKLRRAFVLHNSRTGTYIKPKAKKKTSFTEQLRNEKGYQDYLNKRFNLVK